MQAYLWATASEENNNNSRYLKVNREDLSGLSFWCYFCWLSVHPILTSIFDFEHAIAGQDKFKQLEV